MTFEGRRMKVAAVRMLEKSPIFGYNKSNEALEDPVGLKRAKHKLQGLSALDF